MSLSILVSRRFLIVGIHKAVPKRRGAACPIDKLVNATVHAAGRRQLMSTQMNLRPLRYLRKDHRRPVHLQTLGREPLAPDRSKANDTPSFASAVTFAPD
jgi:hypothetical protein